MEQSKGIGLKEDDAGAGIEHQRGDDHEDPAAGARLLGIDGHGGDNAIARALWNTRVAEVYSSTIGVKGMMVAAKSMALTTVDLFTDPAHIQKAKAEFDQKRGPNFVYKTRLADRKPALDYRT